LRTCLSWHQTPTNGVPSDDRLARPDHLNPKMFPHLRVTLAYMLFVSALIAMDKWQK